MQPDEEIIIRQIESWERSRLDGRSNDQRLQVVTVSRQYGSRGSYVATRLAETLGYGRFHRGLIDTICRNEEYLKRVLGLLDQSEIEAMQKRAELIIKSNNPDEYIKSLCHLVYAMSCLGSVVIIGRAGNFILGMEEGFHVRYVAPVQKRIDNLSEYKRIDPKLAKEEIIKIKRERKEFVRSNFGIGIDDPANYDLIINTAHIDVEEAVGITLEAFAVKVDRINRS